MCATLGVVLLVDAANVIGSEPTGWWRDRPGAARRLTERVRAAAVASVLEDRVVLVLEGQAERGVEEGTVDGVEVVHARGHGDEAIFALAATTAANEEVVVVSADRGLAERVRGVGAAVVGPRWLLERLAP